MPTIQDFLATLDHPHKAEILRLRDIILAADVSISDGVKWNSLSFRTTEYFATVHLRAKRGVQIIMHLGARPVATSEAGIDIDDPHGMLTWLAKDRASVTFLSMTDIDERAHVFTTVIRSWIRHVP